MQESNKNVFYLVIIFIYAILSQTFFSNFGVKFTSIINPIFWIVFFLIMYLTKVPQIINKRNEKRIIQYVIVAALAYIIIYYVCGLFVTFGRSPYANTIRGIITNFWVTGTVILGRELARNRIMSGTKKNQAEMLKIFVIIVFTLLEVDMVSFISSITKMAVVFEKIVSSLIPVMIKNILFTMIVQKYSCKPAIIYEIIIKMFFWISPILPNSPWILIAILDSTILLILLVFVKNDMENIHNIMINRRNENNSPKDIIKLGIVLVPVACFSIGLFPVHPKAIATASMYPEIKIGDVVIVQKCGINDIKEGDIIEYQIESQNIVHRVTKIEVEDNIFEITTKGDNNNQEDANHVFEEQLIGKVVFKIEYLGLPAVWISKFTRANETIHVETGK